MAALLDNAKAKGRISKRKGFLTVAIFRNKGLNYAKFIVLEENILF
jgi:hypothetical protein